MPECIDISHAVIGCAHVNACMWNQGKIADLGLGFCEARLVEYTYDIRTYDDQILGLRALHVCDAEPKSNVNDVCMEDEV